MHRKRIAVLGGSFNPPHYGHLTVAQGVLKNFECDEVWLMPCFKHAEGKKLAPPAHRMAMTRLAVKALGNKRVKTSDFEMRFLRRKNYTADTVRSLQKRFPHCEFSWVFGSELVRQFPYWTKWSVLHTLLPIVVYPRPGFKKPSKKFVEQLDGKLVFLPARVRKSRVSSTLVRSLLAKKIRGVSLLLPREVFYYIQRHNLYNWKK